MWHSDEPAFQGEAFDFPLLYLYETMSKVTTMKKLALSK